MNEVRKTFDETKYAAVIDQLKSIVFTGDRQEGAIVKYFSAKIMMFTP
jgi:hypothetical protein